MPLTRLRLTGRAPKEIERSSKRLRKVLGEPGSVETAVAAAKRQHMPPDLEARLAVAKPLVETLRRFRYEETGHIAALLLALDADEAEWIETVQRTAELLHQLLEATREDQAEELYAYGVKESEMPELEAEIKRVTAPYLPVG